MPIRAPDFTATAMRGIFSRASTRSLSRSRLAPSMTATPATRPTIGTTRPTPASSNAPLAITAATPATAFSVSPSHCMGGSIARTDFKIA